MQQLAIVMHANRQWAHLSTFQDLVDLFMRQFEILAGGHLKLNQADIIMLVTIRAPVPEASTRSMRVEP